MYVCRKSGREVRGLGFILRPASAPPVGSPADPFPAVRTGSVLGRHPLRDHGHGLFSPLTACPWFHFDSLWKTLPRFRIPISIRWCHVPDAFPFSRPGTVPVSPSVVSGHHSPGGPKITGGNGWSRLWGSQCSKWAWGSCFFYKQDAYHRCMRSEPENTACLRGALCPDGGQLSIRKKKPRM